MHASIWTVPLATALCALTPPAASAQVPSGPLVGDQLFDPDGHVPLSDFVPTVESPGTTVVQMKVQPDLLAWARAQNEPVRVAWHDTATGAVSYLAPTAIDLTGTDYHIVKLSVTPTPVATYTVVLLNGLMNDFMEVECPDESAIVTHWKNPFDAHPEGCHTQNDNDSPRGCRVQHENDALSLLTYVPGLEDVLCESEPKLGTEVIQQLTFNDPQDPLNPYYFNSASLALFSDGSGVHDTALVPAHERYIGENYATKGVTKLACVWLSDQIREAHGFPVVHRQGFRAFSPMGDHEGVLKNVPVMQAVHAWEVIVDETPADGYDNSLGTFLLPPGWTDQGAEYPMIFNGMYDIHDLTFGIGGKEILRAMSSLHSDHGVGTIGVLWNGGGAAACYVGQDSANENAHKLLRDANVLAHGDKDKILMRGGSRGGSTALMIAASCAGEADLTVPYIIAATPQSDIYESFSNYNNLTYFLTQSAIQSYSGYRLAWLPIITGPNGEPGWEIALDNIFGSHDELVVDQKSPSGLVEPLAMGGSSIVLRFGTHDFSNPFSLRSAFADSLRVAQAQHGGGDLRVEYSYRFGHGYALATTPDEVDLVLEMVGGSSSLGVHAGDYYYRRDDSGNVYCSELFLAQCQENPAVDELPLLIEAPIVVTAAMGATLEVNGPRGRDYGIVFMRVTEDWEATAPPTPAQILETRFIQGTIDTPALPPTGETFAKSTIPIELDGVFELGQTWWYTFGYVDACGNLRQSPVGSASTPDWPEPHIRFGPAPAKEQHNHSRTGGLAMDQVFN